MKITHFIKTGEFKDAHDSWDGDDGYYAEIELDDEDAKELLIDYISEQYNLPYENVAKFINDLGWFAIDDLINEFQDDLEKFYERQHYGEDIE